MPNDKPAGQIQTAAYISDDRRFRYWLTRTWDPDLPAIAFIGVNPSTADETKDDATIRKEIGFARRLGFGKLVALNVGAFRARNPIAWKKATDPIGPLNSAEHIARYIRAFNVTKTIAAWGIHGNAFPVYCQTIAARIPDLYCLGTNNDGSPRHPLMLSYSTRLEPFDYAAAQNVATSEREN